MHSPPSQPFFHPERFVDSIEAAEFLGIHPKTLQKYSRSGLVPASYPRTRSAKALANFGATSCPNSNFGSELVQAQRLATARLQRALLQLPTPLLVIVLKGSSALSMDLWMTR